MSARQRIDPIRLAAASGDGSVQVRWKPERKVEGRLWPGAVAVPQFAKYLLRTYPAGLEQRL